MTDLPQNVRDAWATYHYEKHEQEYSRIDEVYQRWFANPGVDLLLEELLELLSWTTEQVQEHNEHFGTRVDWYHDAQTAIRPGLKGVAGWFDYNEPEMEMAEEVWTWGNHKQVQDAYDATVVDGPVEAVVHIIDAIIEEHPEVLEQDG